MSSALRDDQRATFEDFLLFLESRPDEERWELNDGVAIMMPPPAVRHQTIVDNITAYLKGARRRLGATWVVHSGIGVHVPALGRRSTVPDVTVRLGRGEPETFCDDPIVLFEVLSRSTRANDLGWKARFAAGIPTLEAYVVVEQDRMHIEVATRSGGWRRREVPMARGGVAVEALGLAIPFEEIYLDTGLWSG